MGNSHSSSDSFFTEVLTIEPLPPLLLLLLTGFGAFNSLGTLEGLATSQSSSSFTEGLVTVQSSSGATTSQSSSSRLAAGFVSPHMSSSLPSSDAAIQSSSTVFIDGTAGSFRPFGTAGTAGTDTSQSLSSSSTGLVTLPPLTTEGFATSQSLSSSSTGPATALSPTEEGFATSQSLSSSTGPAAAPPLTAGGLAVSQSLSSSSTFLTSTPFTDFLPETAPLGGASGTGATGLSLLLLGLTVSQSSSELSSCSITTFFSSSL